MEYVNEQVRDLKIAYIGGGSRGWAWGLMSDLAMNADMSGRVALYDIDPEAARYNAVIGNRIRELPDCRSRWEYEAVETIGDALTGADFVVISIMPGTFDEMASDVHTPEQYGIWQSVGDTTGPGGILRSLRTAPMMEQIAHAIRDYAPGAWVINYTNPMAICVRALYDAFPQIKAFGCCHEVFGTQKVLAAAMKEVLGLEADRSEIKVNVVGVNHFTWFTEARYRNLDLFPVYAEFGNRYHETGYGDQVDSNWMNNAFACREKVKLDLFRRFGYIAAAGDRHLAEFCPAAWYLKDPDTAHSYGFGLTTVDWRKGDLVRRREKSQRLYDGAQAFELAPTGEEGVEQMRALLGLRELVSNVNIPNVGQIPNLPLGAVVETNAVFRSDSLQPVFAGPVPEAIHGLIAPIADIQLLTAQAIRERDLETAYQAFVQDPLMTISPIQARELFDRMVENTRHYLGMYRREA